MGTTKKATFIIAVVLLVIGLFTNASFAQGHKKCDGNCGGKYHGIAPTEDELKKILADHEKWVLKHFSFLIIPVLNELEKVPQEGRGILLGGVPGVAPAEVVIIGGGVVETNAAKVAAGLGARVTILDINLNRLRYLSDIMPPNVITLMSNASNIREKIAEADLLI